MSMNMSVANKLRKQQNRRVPFTSAQTPNASPAKPKGNRSKPGVKDRNGPRRRPGQK